MEIILAIFFGSTANYGIVRSLEKNRTKKMLTLVFAALELVTQGLLVTGNMPLGPGYISASVIFCVAVLFTVSVRETHAT